MLAQTRRQDHAGLFRWGGERYRDISLPGGLVGEALTRGTEVRGKGNCQIGRLSIHESPSSIARNRMLLKCQHGSEVQNQCCQSLISPRYASRRWARLRALNGPLRFGKMQALVCADAGAPCQLRLQHHWPSAATHRGAIPAWVWFSLNLWREP